MASGGKNHESFLQMIGLTDPGLESPKSTPAPVESPRLSMLRTSEFSNVEEVANHSAATEWELQEAELERELDAMNFEHTETETETEAEATYDAPERLTKTEQFSSYEFNAQPESTSVYSNTEVRSVSSHDSRNDYGDSSTASGTIVLSRSVYTAALPLIEKTEIGKTTATRPTQAFDYDEKIIAEAEAEFQNEEVQTAHFDYDENESSGSRLVCLDGKVNSKAFHLGRFPLRIGRDAVNEVVVDDFNVSRYHAELDIREDGKIYIIDKESTNGVKVNGALVTEHPLASRDVIQVGDAMFEFLAPGVLSKGIPLTKVVEESAGKANTTLVADEESVKRRKKRKLLLVAASLFLILSGGFYLYSKRDGIEQAVQEVALQAVATQIDKEIGKFKTELESEIRKPVQEMEAEEVKTAFIQRMDQVQGAQLISDEIKSQVKSLPPEAIKLFVEDSSILADMVLNQNNPKGFAGVLQRKIAELIKDKRYQEGLALIDYLLTLDPQNDDLKSLASALRGRIGDRGVENVEEPEVSVAQEDVISNESVDRSGYQGSEVEKQDRKKFAEFVASYKQSFDRYIAQKRIDQAISYGKLVQNKLEELSAKEPKFAKLAADDLERWTQMVSETEKKYEERKAEEKKIWQKRKRGDQLLESIKVYLDLGEASKAREAIEKFLFEYRDHPSFSLVQQMKKDQEKTIRSSIDSAKTMIEEYIKTESFSNAWKEVYKFVDVMPFDPTVQDLKRTVEKAVGGRAAQFYNQARVFEYETDDLVAAEQFYKRALETADPHSELSSKASRRYEEVKRKSLR